MLGVSGRAILKALVAGERDPKTLTELAKGKLRKKLPSCARHCAAASATIMGCWSGWRLGTWSTWKAPSPLWTAASTR